MCPSRRGCWCEGFVDFFSTVRKSPAFAAPNDAKGYAANKKGQELIPALFSSSSLCWQLLPARLGPQSGGFVRRHYKTVHRLVVLVAQYCFFDRDGVKTGSLAKGLDMAAFVRITTGRQ